jgi:uncharacterized membrane protein YhaH (DUF805 family)
MLSWRGRANRGTLYASLGLLSVIYLPFQFIQARLGITLPIFRIPHLLAAGAVELAIAALIGGLLVRRLHDRGKSGWWLLVFFGPTLVLGEVASLPEHSQLMESSWFVATLVVLLTTAPFMLWGMIEVFIVGSFRGPNRYGNDPPEVRAGAG